MTPLSLAINSKFCSSFNVSWVFKCFWNVTWTKLELWSMNRQPPEYMLEFRLLPAEENSLPFVPQMKWWMETCWPGIKFSALRTPAWSLIAVETLVGAGRWCCFPYWHAAHLGGLTIWQAAVCSDQCVSLWLRTPACIMNQILQNDKCPSQWCHLSNSFSASVKLRLLSWTVFKVRLRAATTFGVS